MRSISTAALPIPLCANGYVGPRVNYALFTDPACRDCVATNEFTHVEQFNALACTDRGIQSIQGIEQLKELRIITLDINTINDLSVKYNQISDIGAIGQLNTLQNLDARNNNLQYLVWDLRTLDSAVLIDLRSNPDIKCLEYANLMLVLGTAVLFNECTYP